MNEPTYTNITLPRAWLKPMIDRVHDFTSEHKFEDGECEMMICAILSEYERLKLDCTFRPNPER
jgi:hypothetical protein